MLNNKLREFTSFFAMSWKIMDGQKAMLSVFVVLSILAALTEGVGVTMLIPILESQSNQSLFANIPVMSEFASLFEGMSQGEKLKTVAVVLGVILILRGFLIYAVAIIGGMIPVRFERELFHNGYAALLRADYTYFSEKSIGDHMNSLRVLGARLAQLLTGFVQVINNTLLLIMYLFLMLSLSWKLALAAFAFVLVLTIFLKLFTSGPLHKAGGLMSLKDSVLNETIHETMLGMKFLRLSAAEDIMLDRYTKRLDEKKESQIKMALFQPIPHPVLVTCAGLFICALLYAASFVEQNSDVWLSELLVFLFLLTRLLSPVTQINTARGQIFSHFSALELLEGFFKETAERVQPDGTQPYRPIKESIRFENVDFQYSQSDDRAIKNLSLEIPAGKMVAIVGPSGSGKSTLVSLLTRFYELQSGTIKFDGTDMTEFDLADLRRNISVVSQDIFIFNDTVKNNLSFSLDGVSEDDIQNAAKLAVADEFITALPGGFNTMLGDRGMRLSGGQRQRIAIARAFLRDPDFLILDEATSHLDTFTEKAIQSAVEILRKDRTILVIAHRLSTIQQADLVAVLKDGQIAEIGSHQDLMNARGAYWEMVSDQKLDLIDEAS